MSGEKKQGKNKVEKLDKSYLSQLKNSSMRRLLLDPDNFPVLEELLYLESERLKTIQQRKSGLDFGEEVDRLDYLLRDVKAEVDNFLGCSKIDSPRIGHSGISKTSKFILGILYSTSALTLAGPVLTAFANHNNLEMQDLVLLQIGALELIGTYSLHNLQRIKVLVNHYGDNSIKLASKKRVGVISGIGHEYAHHVQFKKGLGYKLKKYHIFMEGHARGVQRHVSNTYREREDNDAFLYKILDSTVGELKSAYIWICKKLSKPIRKSLLDVKSSCDFDEKVNKILLGGPSHYALGNALFSILEAEYGSQIYRQALHGEFQFRK